MPPRDPEGWIGSIHSAQDVIQSTIDVSLRSLDKATLDVWAKLMEIVRGVSPGDSHAAYFHSLAAARELLPELMQALGGSLMNIALFAHESNLRSIVDRLPVAYLDRLRTRAGELPTGLARFRPYTIDPETGDMKRNEFTKYLIRAPDAERVGEIIRRGNWTTRFGQMARIGNPEQVANAVQSAFARGLTPGEIAREIKPLVAGVASSAKLRARTLGQQVAHTVRMDAYEEMGDLIEAYQLHATGDNLVRPEHKARDGRIYWKDASRGKYSTDVMPQPPLEEDGSLAWNCRCYLTPRLRPVSRLKAAA